MTEKIEKTALDNQTEEVIESWYEKSISNLLESGRMPMTDDVWATDKYSELIYANAQDLYCDYLYEISQPNV